MITYNQVRDYRIWALLYDGKPRPSLLSTLTRPKMQKAIMTRRAGALVGPCFTPLVNGVHP